MASLTLQGSSSGQITLATPAVAGTNTITLPAATGTLVTSESASISGNLTFTGTGNRILGDFSNATVSNRVAFQTSTTNGNTVLLAITDGTGTASALQLSNTNNRTNAAYAELVCNATESQIKSSAAGTGTYLPITFYTNGSERMRLDTSGNLGIGNTSPSWKVDVLGSSPGVRVRDSGSTNGAVFQQVSGGNTYLNLQDSAALIFNTANTERMRIDSSGNVGIGTTSPGNRLHISGASNAQSGVSIQSTGASGRKYTIYSSSAGGLYFANDTGGGDQMVLDASGNLLVGTTSQAYSSRLEISHTNLDGITTIFNGTTGNNAMKFRNGNGQVGAIVTSGTTTAYNTSSDYRLKENVQPMTTGLAKISALKPVTYDWISDKSEGEGFIAHELQSVIPLAVTGEKDAVDDDGNPIHQGVDYSKIVVHLVAAMQEQQSIISDLKSRIAALEAK